MTTQCVRLIRSRQPIRSVRITSSFGENENAAAEMAAASANQGPSPEELEQARLQQEADRSFLQTVMQDIAESIEELEQRRAQSLEELQQVAVTLAIHVTGAILGRQLADGEFPIEAQVQRAIQQLEGNGAITIHVNPHDLTRLDALMKQADVDWKLPADARLNGDASLERGSCWAERGDLGLLVTLQQQLGDMSQELRKGLPNAQVERRSSPTEDQLMRRFPDRRETA